MNQVELDGESSLASMLGSRDDMDHARACFDARGMVVLSNFLTPAFAEAVLADLERLGSNQLWYRNEKGDPLHLSDSTPEGFAFKFDKYLLTHRQSPVAGSALRRFCDLILSNPMSDVVQRLTGLGSSPHKTEAFASRFRSGDFLSKHSDSASGTNRLCAFVLNLTKQWRPHWGGHLLMLDEQASTAEILLPTFNQLVVFRVPKPHLVSAVMSPCPGVRYACTGWFVG